MLSSEKLLEIWEAGLNRRPLVRALEVLRVAGMVCGGEDLAGLPLGARDLRLLALREQTFGSEVTGLSDCPQCGKEVEMHFQLEQIRLPEGEPPDVLTLDESGADYAVRFRAPTTADLLTTDLVGEEQEDGRRLLQRCISQASRNGQPITAEELPEAVQQAVAHSIAASDPQAEVELSLQCPACGKGWREIFDIESFLWSELQAWAGRMLREIHELASAYGWREREVLALSPLRRSIYLSLIAE